MTTREENLKKLNNTFEKLDGEKLEKIAGGSYDLRTREQNPDNQKSGGSYDFHTLTQHQMEGGLYIHAGAQNIQNKKSGGSYDFHTLEWNQPNQNEPSIIKNTEAMMIL